MNDDVLENQKDGDSSLKDSEPFKKQYAAVLIQLNEVNDQVCIPIQVSRTCRIAMSSSRLFIFFFFFIIFSFTI